MVTWSSLYTHISLFSILYDVQMVTYSSLYTRISLVSRWFDLYLYKSDHCIYKYAFLIVCCELYVYLSCVSSSDWARFTNTPRSSLCTQLYHCSVFPTLRGIWILGILMKRPSWSCFRDTTRACQVLHSSPAVRDWDRGHIYPGLFLPGHHSLTDICQTSDHYPGSHYGKHIPQSFHGETSRHLTSRK